MKLVVMDSNIEGGFSTMGGVEVGGEIFDGNMGVEFAVNDIVSLHVNYGDVNRKGKGVSDVNDSLVNTIGVLWMMNNWVRGVEQNNMNMVVSYLAVYASKLQHWNGSNRRRLQADIMRKKKELVFIYDQ
ncbi:hypothetical protein QYF36_014419 [Acer negundo]|nr:hypothetical protein QYF36_014419 [Acer negundo]